MAMQRLQERGVLSPRSRARKKILEEAGADAPPDPFDLRWIEQMDENGRLVGVQTQKLAWNQLTGENDQSAEEIIGEIRFLAVFRQGVRRHSMRPSFLNSPIRRYSEDLPLLYRSVQALIRDSASSYIW